MLYIDSQLVSELENLVESGVEPTEALIQISEGIRPSANKPTALAWAYMLAYAEAIADNLAAA